MVALIEQSLAIRESFSGHSSLFDRVLIEVNRRRRRWIIIVAVTATATATATAAAVRQWLVLLANLKLRANKKHAYNISQWSTITTC